MNELLGSGDPDFDGLCHPSSAELRSRAQVLVEKFKLDPCFMQEVDSRYGPLDWRLPESHAIYWAARGLLWLDEAAKEPSWEVRWLHRIVLSALASSFQHGLLRSLPNSEQVELGPNLEVIPKLDAAYDRAMKEEQGLRDNLRNAQRHFLQHAVLLLYINGRVDEGSQWYRAIGERYPGQPLFSARPQSVAEKMKIDDYVLDLAQQDIGSANAEQVAVVVEGFLRTACLSLARDEDQRANGFIHFASMIWDRVIATQAIPLKKPLRTFQELKQSALDQLLDSPHQLDPTLSAHLRSKLGLSVTTPGARLPNP
jgi:hypothetical protein